jgi:hypothetical protein
MNSSWKPALWSQFGASIDMLENAMHAPFGREAIAGSTPEASELT